MNETTQILCAEYKMSMPELVRHVRRAIVTVAWQLLVAGRITAADYHKRVERANVKGPQAPYYSMQVTP